MDKLPYELHLIIADYIIKPKYEITSITHKIMHIFRGNKYKIFIKAFIESLFKQYGILYSLPYITINERLKIAAKILNKISITRYTNFKLFNNHINFKLEKAGGKERRVIYFLSIIYGYIWYSKVDSSFDKWKISYNYDKLFGPYGTKKFNLYDIISYDILKKNKIHNLNNYDLIEDNINKYKRTYRLKSDRDLTNLGISIYCIGPAYTLENMNIVYLNL